MLRKTEFLEAEDEAELLEAVDYAKSRHDGGRTHITLTGGRTYVLHKPLTLEVESRVTIDGDGREIKGFV